MQTCWAGRDVISFAWFANPRTRARAGHLVAQRDDARRLSPLAPVVWRRTTYAPPRRPKYSGEATGDPAPHLSLPYVLLSSFICVLVYHGYLRHAGRLGSAYSVVSAPRQVCPRPPSRRSVRTATRSASARRARVVHPYVFRKALETSKRLGINVDGRVSPYLPRFDTF